MSCYVDRSKLFDFEALLRILFESLFRIFHKMRAEEVLVDVRVTYILTIVYPLYLLV